MLAKNLQLIKLGNNGFNSNYSILTSPIGASIGYRLNG